MKLLKYQNWNAFCGGTLYSFPFNDCSISDRRIRESLNAHFGPPSTREGLGVMVLAAVNSGQKKVAKSLERFGFKLLRTWINANSGNEVSVYYYMHGEFQDFPKEKSYGKKSKK